MKMIFNRSVSVILSAVMLFASALSLNGCGGKDNSQTTEAATTIAETTQAFDEPQQKRKIIIDTDTAGDDASALIIAAKAKNIDILGVTVSAGNVSLDQAVKNALMTLEMAGSDAPVYAGASATYTGKEREAFSVYGKDGMGDQDLIHPMRKAEDKGAVDFIVETVKANPDEVEIVALGPVTNLALAFDKDPETMKHVKKYWSMGTAGFGLGNATPVAEFNVYHDAEAYKVLVDSGVEITAIGFDMLPEETNFSKEELDELEKKGGLSEFFAKAFNRLIEFNTEARGLPIADDPDGVAMACVLWDGYLKKTQPCHASVMTDDNEAYGQVILYKEGYDYDSQVTFDNYNFYVATETDSKIFKEKLIALLDE
ncbi:MAG: nucleoside hydrolase [Lachnospiraceae bacterium]|nr:nucleoside hydrolase [Lachnospiraceae bacterium]